MAWLELTRAPDEKILVNMDNIVRVSPSGRESRLLTIAFEKEGTHSFTVAESPDEIANMLNRADELVTTRRT
jgi:hypothetical protein